MRLAARDSADEANDKRMQIESTIEPIGEGSEKVAGVLAVVECVVGTRQGRLQIAQGGVDPSEFGQVAWLGVTDDGRHVHATGSGHCPEAGEAVTGGHGARSPMQLGPLFDGIERKSGYQRELEVHRTAQLVERDSGNERNLVFGAAADLAAGALAGAGYAGLNLLADFQPDIIKFDMALVRGIDTSRSRQAITRGVLRICFELDIAVIAEGVETEAERDFFFDEGVSLIQGYLFSRPAFQNLGKIAEGAWPGSSQPLVLESVKA